MKIKPEPKALRAAIKSAENWDPEIEHSCAKNFYRQGWEDETDQLEVDLEYGGPAVAYWAVASEKHRKELSKKYKTYIASNFNSALRYLVHLSNGDYYAEMIDEGDLSFLDLWRAHLPT